MTQTKPQTIEEIFDSIPIHSITASDGITDDYWDAVNAKNAIKQSLIELFEYVIGESTAEEKRIFIDPEYHLRRRQLRRQQRQRLAEIGGK